MQNENLHSFEITVRRTFIIPIFKIVLLQIVFIGIYAVLLWKLNQVSASPLKSGGIIAFLLLQTIQSMWSLYIIIRWFFNYYQITTKEILVHSGFFSQKRKHFSLEKAESVTLEKSFVGRIFNFGTICVDLFMSNSRYEVYLHQVPNPEKYSQMIEETITQFGSNGKEHEDDSDN